MVEGEGGEVLWDVAKCLVDLWLRGERREEQGEAGFLQYVEIAALEEVAEKRLC